MAKLKLIVKMKKDSDINKIALKLKNEDSTFSSIGSTFSMLVDAKSKEKNIFKITSKLPEPKEKVPAMIFV
jgi:hypothetical protein